MKIAAARVVPVRLPLRAPLDTAHERIEVRRGALLVLAAEGGCVGLGEATPIGGFGLESAGEARAQLAALAAAVVGRDARELDVLLDAAEAAAPAAPVARAALDGALHDLAAQAAGVSLAAFLASRGLREAWAEQEAAGQEPVARARVPVSALLAATTPIHVGREAARARARGFSCVKLKLGAAGGLERDVARVSAAREALGPGVGLRLDVNGAWSAPEAEAALARLAPLDVELVEQPVAAGEVEALAWLRARSPIALAADESAASAAGLERVLALRAADVVVLKPSALGGLRAARRLAARARAAGCDVVVTSLLDGAVARAGALALAASLPGPLRACGLATGGLLAADLAPRERLERGRLAVPARLGLGVALDERRLARLRDDEDAASRRGRPPRPPRLASSQALVPAPARARAAAVPPGRRAARAARPTSDAGPASARAARARPESAAAAGPWWLGARAAATPEAPALRFAGRTLSFAELAALAERAARGLRAAGAARGARVALLLENGPLFVALAHAAQRAGVVLVPLGPRLTAPELAFQLAEARVDLLVHGGGGLARRARAAAREAHARRVPPAKEAVRCVSAEALERRIARSAGAARAGDRGAPLLDAIDPSAPAAIVFTSGTTGRPKGAVLSWASFRASAAGSAAHVGSRPGDRWLACMPLHHVGGLAILWRSVLDGSAVVLHERFDAEAAARALDEEAITLASFVPTMLRRVLDARAARPAPPALRAVLVGGAAAPFALLARARRLGLPVLPTYGLTEAASQVATLPRGAPLREDGGGLRPLPGNALRILAEDGTPRAPGRPGEIAVRGPTLMQGYDGRPDETARVLAGGWLRTGDVGVLDASGALRVLDRRSDLVVSGGENVYPAEVEAALLAHPDVDDAGVAGLPHADLGRCVTAWVVLRRGARPDAPALERFLRARLAGYKTPRSIRFVEALPRGAGGKLDRRALARMRASTDERPGGRARGEAARRLQASREPRRRAPPEPPARRTWSAGGLRVRARAGEPQLPRQGCVGARPRGRARA